MITINIDRLEKEKSELKEEFNSKVPFRYLIIDDFLHQKSANNILEEFPKITQEWTDARGLHTQNKWSHTALHEGVAKKFYEEINSKFFLSYLSELTNIKGLTKDPDLNGAGYHQTTNNGFLNIHVDFNRIDGNDKLDRRLNLLVYLNKNWVEKNGGYLELWDMEKKERIGNIKPKFNRCVIFETNEISYHGHPVPLDIEDNQSRKSLSVYYYTKGRDDIPYTKSHNTLYVNTQSVKGIMKIITNGIKHIFRKIKGS